MTLKTAKVCYVTANSQDESYKVKDSECDRLSLRYLSTNGDFEKSIGLYRLIYPVQGRHPQIFSDYTIVTHNTDVFHPERISLIKILVRDAVLGFINADNLSKISRIFISLTELGLEFDIKSKESCLSFYKEYTDYLFSQLRQARIKGKGYKRSTASSYQHALSIALSRLWNVSIDEWKSSYFIISHKNSETPLPTLRKSKHEFQQVYAFFRRFFEETSEYLLSESEKPLYIPFNDLGFKDLVFISNLFHSWRSYESGDIEHLKSFIYDKDKVYRWPEVRKRIEREGIAITEEDAIKVKGASSQLKIRKSGKIRRILANFATMAFVKVLIAETGANPKHLESLDLSTERLESELGHIRLLAVKGRSGYETQPVRMHVSFLSVWRKYLELRKWMVENSEGSIDPGVGILGYSLINKKLTIISAGVISNKTRYFTPVGLPEITAQQWRKFKSQELTNAANGEIKISADLLNQSERTAATHYSQAKFETAAIELQQFFSELRQHSTLIVHDQNRIPPIVKNAAAISTGRCTGSNVEDAIKIDGIDKRTPEPRCGTPVHCYFCKSFGIHKEVGDLKKLLAAKKWVEYQAKSKTEGVEVAMQKYAPITQRIDAILEEFIELDPENLNLLKQATQEVQSGNINIYWLNKLNAIIEAMEY